MRRYEKTKEVVERESLVEMSCDLCGTKASGVCGWADGWYDTNETEVSVTIKHREGCNYPECKMGTEREVDICPACFKNKLIPWLISQGAKIEEKDYES
jgi:hypothetical protein